jgi:AhpD family alkylhydroperoxidase
VRIGQAAEREDAEGLGTAFPQSSLRRASLPSRSSRSIALLAVKVENSGETMATLGLIEYKDARPEVRAVYDDIMATRKVDWINNFWKAIAHDLVTLKRTWEDIKQIMAPGALDPLTKEMIYVAVSVSNQCGYCIASHTASARKKGMTDEMFKELMAVVGMANETNKMVTGYQVEVDEQFKT